MTTATLMVRASELYDRVGRRPFVALPREEIERFHAAVDLHGLRADALSADPDLLQVGTLTAIHRNHQWRAVPAAAGGLSLATYGSCDPIDHSGVFLAEDLGLAARRSLDPVLPAEAYELRLAALLVHALIEPEVRWLRLVYVARLRRPFRDSCRAGVEEGAQLGHGDLLERRGELDPASRALLDNLASL